ncbi:hypothetical protein OR571_09015 [Psychrobacillus sp. NEAU-3TGS]|uniref:hypothetical protein n=1 Tax=Psychrobacillus sp. NEAU-3TGS TaxID=2995412 RepID=UPI0024999D53|nr:hypothetical protein [Psychrobacillus sp. NEAU-3TGS]MDI2587239.1 hypothetical protein [Psychrobacillus sp. NEAU-3TGS]
MMVPFLSATIKPFLMITMPPVIILLAAMLMANKDKDKTKDNRISGKHFKRALVLLGALLSYKIFSGYFSK